MDSVNVLIVSKGHDYDHNRFLAMFADMPGVTATLVEQPAAQVVLKPEHVGNYDCVLFYDMSGIPGIGLLHDGAGDTGLPPDDYRASIEALVERPNRAGLRVPGWSRPPPQPHLEAGSAMRTPRLEGP